VGTSKDETLNLYNLEETPDAVYDAMMRLEGRYKSLKLTPYDGDDKLVQAHIKMKCREIRAVKDALGLHCTGVPSPDRINERRVEKDLASEEVIRSLLRNGRTEL